MGLFSRLLPRPAASPPARGPTLPPHVIGRRSYSFPSQTAADSFVSQSQQAIDLGTPARPGPVRTPLFDYIRLNNIAESYGGELVYSQTNKEYRTYGYVEMILDIDRKYLARRDPTAKTIITKPAWDLWWCPPRTNIPAVDSFLASLVSLGLPEAGASATKQAMRDGGAFLYVETTATNPSARISRGERIVSIRAIPRERVIWNNDDPETAVAFASPPDSLTVDHRIEQVWVYLTKEDKRRGTPTLLHGSRLIRIREDVEAEEWFGESLLDAIHDSLWELRDILWSRSRSHFEGDPIIVDVDLSAEAQQVLNLAGLTQAQLQAMAEDVTSELQDFRSGAIDIIAPQLGFKMRRLSGAKLPDASDDIATHFSRIANGSILPIKMLMASTKGQSDVEDQDILTYLSGLGKYRGFIVYPALTKLLRIGQVLGRIPVRGVTLPSCDALIWPRVRPLTPRDEAFVKKTNSAILRQQWEIGRTLPPHELEQFPVDPDPAPILPVYALRGRLPDGSSADAEEPDEEEQPLPQRPAPPDDDSGPVIPAARDRSAHTRISLLEARIEAELDDFRSSIADIENDE